MEKLKLLIRDAKLNIKTMPAAMNAVVIVSFLFFGMYSFFSGENAISSESKWISEVIYMSILGSSYDRRISDVYKLLPLDDGEIKLIFVFRKIVLSLVISIFCYIALIPYMIKTGTYLMTFLTFIRLFVMMVGYMTIYDGVTYHKKTYPHLLYRIIKFILLIVVASILFAMEKKDLSNIPFVTIAVAGSLLLVAVFTAIEYWMLDKIPVDEMKFNEKRKIGGSEDEDRD